MTPLNNLSLEVAAQVDIEDGELEPTEGSEESLYAQPALKDEPDERQPFPYRREGEALEEFREATAETNREVAPEVEVTLDATRNITLDPETLEMTQSPVPDKKNPDYFM